MAQAKIVLLVIPYDQGDILADFIDWHLDLGFDFILAQDGGSTDGSRAILDRYAQTGRLAWFPLPERDMSKYDMIDTMAEMARDQYGADWLVFIDVDEFLCTDGASLRSILDDAQDRGVSTLDIRRYNMTGPLLQPGESATRTFTLRIDNPTPLKPEEMQPDLPAPYLFASLGAGKVAVRAAAVEGYGLGMHTVRTTWGSLEKTGRLRILHYALRGYAELEVKVANARRWFADNPQLPEGWAIHWRRWVRLQDKGLLRADYEEQFVAPEQAAALVQSGVCTVDETVLRWLQARDRPRAAPPVPTLLQRLGAALRGPFKRPAGG